ncbi:MAG: hypothetical protein ACRENI_02195 [Gemmatimonadaceae bacterium]
MIAAFDFEDGGRTYKCSIAKTGSAQAEPWWWFGVSGDAHRYAPFHAAASDTQASVRSRVVAFYLDRLARRAMPAVPRPHWSNRNKPAAPAQR